MKNVYLVISLCLASYSLFSQEYVGAGQNVGVTITFSSEEGESTADKTLDGSGLDAPYFEASRFLAQATLGYNHQDIIDLKEDGLNFDNWITDQIAIPPRYHLPLFDSIYQEALDLFVANGGNEDDYRNPHYLHYNYTWWQSAMTSTDQLRQRVALALSEIFVISANQNNLANWGEGFADYYDIFLEHAFGNFEDILTDVTYHPTMGHYLSHLNNPKSNGNQVPDENYAREIMQLFTIGLYKLNNNGSEQTDANGPIPTYDNDDIDEFAKIFTGLYGGESADPDNPGDVQFGDWIGSISRKVPMQMQQSQHEPGAKYLLDGYVVPSGQSGDEDIADAISHLVGHQNTGPFISIRLIQRLVKSNPSPQYIARVANVFNNNGSGVKGDMEAVIRAILLDPEAREGDYMLQPDAGQLREPIIRYSQFARAVENDSPEGRYWNSSYFYYNSTSQIPFYSPTVFNFFSPDYAPNGPVSDEGMVAPEFQIFNSRTSIGYINEINRFAVYESLMWSWEDGDPAIATIMGELEEIAEVPEVLINRLDMLFTHGQLSQETRAVLRTALDNFHGWTNQNWQRARLGLYLIMISPDYAILK